MNGELIQSRDKNESQTANLQPCFSERVSGETEGTLPPIIMATRENWP